MIRAVRMYDAASNPFHDAIGRNMASSIVDELFDRLIHAFPADHSYGHSDFAAEPMPAPVAQFLDQLLQRRLDLEMRNMRDATSAWVDAGHPEVHDAARAFRTAIQPHVRIPRSEWGSVLRRAVQRVTAYLIHPTQTMTNFVFGDQDGDRSADSIRERVRFFSAYPYLREAVDALIERESASSLPRSRFQAALRRVDEQMTTDYDADDWMRLIDPLFRLMELTSQRGVPVSFLQTFFQSKNASDIVQRLQAASLERGTTVLDRPGLRRLIAARAVPSGDAAPDSPPTPPSPANSADQQAPSHRNTSASSSSEPADASSDASSKAAEGPTPLWKQFQDAGGLSTDHQPPSQAPKPVNEVADGAPLWQRFRPASASSDAASSDDASSNAQPSNAQRSDAQQAEGGRDLLPLERAVMGERGPANRDLFVRELFNGSAEDYRQTLQRLREAPNWTRASQIIAQDVFRTHRVNIYSEPAVLFTNAVEDRFRQRS